ncbi:nucleolar protein dao-5-like [Anopheles darlingi]|uniref:nucleolar protein dao-5-like n=1 Tax=Anopheles darlingi TaxID=43151 RepID=UPI0021001888|nr:nucleolar protein dao-5-like [Anopheles darlingi]
MGKRLYEQCCRLCLYSGTEVGLVDVFSIPKLNGVVLELYNIEVTPNDGSTTRVCSVCLKDTLDFNAQIKLYDREKMRVLENNAKILRNAQTVAIPTASGVSKDSALASREKQPSKEPTQTAIKDSESRTEKNSTEGSRAAHHKQQATTESPRRNAATKPSDNRIPSTEKGASDSTQTPTNDKASKGSNAEDNAKDGSRRSSRSASEQSTPKPKNSAKGLDQRSSDKSGTARNENRNSDSGNCSRSSKDSTTSNAKSNDPRQRSSSSKPIDKSGSARSETRTSESGNHNRGANASTTPNAPSQRSSSSKSIDRSGSARSETRHPESRRSSKESAASNAKNRDPRQHPLLPKPQATHSREISSHRVNVSVDSGENRGSISVESSSRSRTDSSKRSTEGREPTKSKNADRTWSVSPGRSGATKHSDNTLSLNRSPNDRDYSRWGNSKPSNKTSDTVNIAEPLRHYLLKFRNASNNTASNQSPDNIVNRGPEKPSAPKHTTAPHSSNADVRTNDGAQSKDKRNVAPEKSDRRESAAKPSTSGTKERPASRNEMLDNQGNTINRKRGPDAPLQLPRIKIRLLNRVNVIQPEVDISPKTATTANALAIAESNAATTAGLTVSVPTTNSTMCTTAMTTPTTTGMGTSSLPPSETVAASPSVHSRVSELRASKPGIPKRRHSVFNTSLIRVSSNLFDSSKECDEFAAIRNNTMLRVDPWSNSVVSNVNGAPVAEGFPQISGDAGINRSSALQPARSNGTTESFALQQQQQQTSMADADMLSTAVQKPGMKRRKSVCVANVRQMLQNEQCGQSNTNMETRIYPITQIPVNNILESRYVSPHNAAPSAQSTLQNNNVPIVSTPTNYGSCMIRSGNTAINPLPLNVPADSTVTAVPGVRLNYRSASIPLHILTRSGPVSTSGGTVKIVTQTDRLSGKTVWQISNANAVEGGDLPRLSIPGEQHRNMPSLVPVTPQSNIQPLHPQMRVIDHSYSAN